MNSKQHNTSISGRISTERRRRGFVVVYLGVTMVVLILFASLAMDYSRVQLSKTQLMTPTDAAARYAATGLSDGTYLTKANIVAGLNKVNGSPLVLQSGDVVTGNWSNGTFTANGTPVNCLTISSQLSPSRGTAIPILFAPGFTSCKVTAKSYATYTGGNAYGLVGLSSALLQNGVITTDSYDASAGPYVAGGGNNMGSVTTNGNFTHNGNVTVSSGLYLQASSTISGNGNFTYGTRTNVSPALSFAVASAGTAATTNNNASISAYASGNNFNMSSGTLHVPAGVYYLNSFSMTGGTLDIDGAATFYVNGNFTISGGTVNTVSNLPSNFTVNVIASAGGNLSNLSKIYMSLYCPTSPINVNACTNLYGTFVGGSLNVNGPCGIHVDESQLSGGGGTINTVK